MLDFTRSKKRVVRWSARVAGSLGRPAAGVFIRSKYATELNLDPLDSEAGLVPVIGRVPVSSDAPVSVIDRVLVRSRVVVSVLVIKTEIALG